MKDERGFKEVIHSVERSEKDKDKFCRAARIERQPMSDARLATLLNYAVGTLAMVMGFAALYMIIYFMGTAGRWEVTEVYMHGFIDGVLVIIVFEVVALVAAAVIYSRKKR